MTTTITNPQFVLSMLANLQGGGSPANLQAPVNHTPAVDLAEGSGAGQVQIVFAETITVVSGTPLVIDLYAGSEDPLNNAFAAADMVAWLLENDSVTTGQNLVAGGGTHPVMGSDQVTVYPNAGAGGPGCNGGCNPAGWPIVSGSSDKFTVTAATGTITGKLTIFAR